MTGRTVFDGEADAPQAAEREDDGELIDALMSVPPARTPSIIVVGDDAVFGITPPRRSAD
ncbi:MAG: hypothetical protein JNK30_07905 [Phenylobacterium sp.]|uniref:hypothetical protein n=1 Tax=Phenylobacterium sp. TaxID=1871053 RepID=UPI001A386B1C|nr:hypothetical protein [Phenylobacterium sp.]MBL8771293.1 hypothetical protein [Phenylobacterium sp.]